MDILIDASDFEAVEVGMRASDRNTYYVSCFVRSKLLAIKTTFSTWTVTLVVSEVTSNRIVIGNRQERHVPAAVFNSFIDKAHP